METKELILGRNPVMEYLKEMGPEDRGRIVVSEKAHGKIIDRIREQARSKGVPLDSVEKSYFSQHGPSSRHQGVALELYSRKKATGDTVENLLSQQGLIVLLDHLTDPHNVGSIIRSTEALGGSGVVIPGSQSAGITATVIKSSAGATARLPVAQVSNAVNFLKEARRRGFWIIGTAEDGEDIRELEITTPAVAVIGSEGEGMRRLTREHCDTIVRIPLSGKTASLNASVAAGIVIHEIINRSHRFKSI